VLAHISFHLLLEALFASCRLGIALFNRSRSRLAILCSGDIFLPLPAVSAYFSLNKCRLSATELRF